MSVSIFGIRHHGPGCARSLRVALEQWEPDIVLVEGPPDAQEVLPLLASAEMKPPVALLIYSPENPARSVYYPFATFSPEWQALSYALARDIPARFMDLPQALQLGQEEEIQEPASVPALDNESPKASPSTQAGVSTVTPAESEGGETIEETREEDPLDLLARAAGYT
ncbi:MAG TPA: DUF5682 family protein, partial [Ktedonobacteraceae bacterium]|nr:DUF5682 family protein [Ktedonobacteraceae bacterium]